MITRSININAFGMRCRLLNKHIISRNFCTGGFAQDTQNVNLNQKQFVTRTPSKEDIDGFRKATASTDEELLNLEYFGQAKYNADTYDRAYTSKLQGQGQLLTEFELPPSVIFNDAGSLELKTDFDLKEHEECKTN